VNARQVNRRPGRQAVKNLARRVPWLSELIRDRDVLRGQVARLENRQRSQADELSRLERQLSRALAPSTPRSHLGYLFIVTYGRSGSTLLQGILNSLPGYLIRGENRSALYHLFQFHGRCLQEAERVRKEGTVLDQTDAFFGMDEYPEHVAISRLRDVARDTIMRPNPDTRVTGFKEIRWHQEDVTDYVTFLRTVFPGARFVINTRDHESVLQSRWWRRTPDAPATLARMEHTILSLGDLLGDDAFRVHFDEYTADPHKLRPLFTWLGEEFDVERVQEVMKVRHSF
jgi:hypothetical protein